MAATVYLIVIVAVYAGLFYSIRWLQIFLHPLEILAIYMFCSTIGQIFLTLQYLNLRLISVTATRSNPLPFWVVEINRFIYVPLLTVWFMAALRMPAFTRLQKASFAAWWLFLIVGMEAIHHSLGFAKYVKWNESLSALFWLSYLGISYLYSRIFRDWVLGKKEAA